MENKEVQNISEVSVENWAKSKGLKLSAVRNLIKKHKVNYSKFGSDWWANSSELEAAFKKEFTAQAIKLKEKQTKAKSAADRRKLYQQAYSAMLSFEALPLEYKDEEYIKAAKAADDAKEISEKAYKTLEKFELLNKQEKDTGEDSSESSNK